MKHMLQNPWQCRFVYSAPSLFFHLLWNLMSTFLSSGLFMPSPAINLERHSVFELSVCMWSHTDGVHDSLRNGNFTKFTASLGTKMNLVDFEVKRSRRDQVWSTKHFLKVMRWNVTVTDNLSGEGILLDSSPSMII